jgi:hypothetical protein
LSLDRRPDLLVEKAMSIGRRHPPVELCDDERQLIDLVPAVEALPAGRTLRHDLAVALLPAAECLSWNAKHLGHRSDAVYPLAALKRHRVSRYT